VVLIILTLFAGKSEHRRPLPFEVFVSAVLTIHNRLTADNEDKSFTYALTDLYRWIWYSQVMNFLTGLPGPKKLKRPNLAISSFKKGQILKNEKEAK